MRTAPYLQKGQWLSLFCLGPMVSPSFNYLFFHFRLALLMSILLTELSSNYFYSAQSLILEGHISLLLLSETC